MKKNDIGKAFYIAGPFIVTILLALHAIADVDAKKKTSENQSTFEKAVCTESKIDQCTSFYETLSNERNYLTAQAEKHQTEFWSQVDFFIKLVGVLAALTAIILGFFGVNSWKQLKEQLQETIKDLFDKDAKSFIDESKTVITAEVNDFRGHLKFIDRELKEITSYKQKSIVWVTDNEAGALDKTVNDEEIHALYAHGFQGIKVITPSSDQDDKFELGTTDLVILSYKKTGQCQKRLKRIISLIASQNPPTYLIIYTFNKDGTQVRIDEVEKNILNGFIWYMMANFPATVIAHSQLLVRQSNILERN